MKEINEVKQPEVGDLWRNKNYGTLLHLIKAQEGYIRFLGCKVEKWGKRTIVEYFENSFTEDDARLEYFTEDYEYLGKAKNPITSIFEVE